MNEKKTVFKKELSKPFVWSWATSVNGGAMAISATIATYFSLYVQETIGITAAHLSIILLICSLWDAINDPIMGVICDTVNPKWGRYRTWFLFTPIFLVVDMFLLFSNPSFIQGSVTAKCVYVCITYMFYGMIVTAYSMPQSAILPAMTLNDEERNDAIAKGAGICAIAFTVASSFSNQLVEIFGSYRNLMVTYAVLTLISFWIMFKTSEERYILPKDKENGGLKQLIFVFRHWEIWPVVIVWCASSVSYGFMFSSSVYYVMYYLGRPDLISQYMLFVSMGALVSMVIMMPIFLKKFKTGYRAIIVSQIFTIALYILLFFTGKMNFMYCAVLSFVATAVGAMVNALTNVLVNDTIDFILLKEGKQLNAVIASVKGFSFKCGSTITNSGILAVLAIFGFSTEFALDQPETAVMACNLLRFLIPAVVSILILVIMLFYPLKKYFPEIAKMKEKMAAKHDVEQ